MSPMSEPWYLHCRQAPGSDPSLGFIPLLLAVLPRLSPCLYPVPLYYRFHSVINRSCFQHANRTCVFSIVFPEHFPSALFHLSTLKATFWRLYVHPWNLKIFWAGTLNLFTLQAFVFVFSLTLFCDLMDPWSLIHSFSFLSLSSGQPF